MSFYYRQKICTFLKRLNHDSGQNSIYLSSLLFCNKKKTLVLSFHDIAFWKKAFWTIKRSFYYSRKTSIFPKGLTHDFCQKFQIVFEPTFLQKNFAFVVLWRCFPKKRLFGRQKCHFTIVEKLAFFQGVNPWFLSKYSK